MFFFAQNSSFYCSVALLCNAKKPSFGQKTPIFRFNQKSQDEFNAKNRVIMKIVFRIIIVALCFLFVLPALVKRYQEES